MLSRVSPGQQLTHVQEERTARYVGKEAAIVFPMGYATNSTVLPNIIGKGGLIVSDSKNHASVIMGCRASGAKITIFKHNGTEIQHLQFQALVLSPYAQILHTWSACCARRSQKGSRGRIGRGPRFSSWWRASTPWKARSSRCKRS